MILNLNCPSCGQTQRVSDEMVGAKMSCSSCGAGLRVAAPKPSGSADPAPESNRAQPASTDYDPSLLPPQIRAQPAVRSHRHGLPLWVFASLGGAAAMVVVGIGIGVLVRSLGGRRASRLPHPAVEIARGVASQSVQPVTAAPSLAANTVPLLTTSAADAPPPPAMSSTGNAPTPTSPARPANTGPLTTAQLVARWEPSVALVKGEASSGTGFLVKPGVVATNAHVIDGEFIANLEVRFPSALAGKQGPLAAELLYEDAKRDLAFLAVSTTLPATEVAPSYSFIKGDEVTVIGNPGLGDDVVLENAISRGVMSSRAVIEGMNYLQLNMAINPGNSGGPVFDSAGRVIGVATLKATKAEAMAFCIPVEDLHAALKRVGPARPDLVSQHRARVAFSLLTAAGALYGIGLDIRAGLVQRAPAGVKANLLPNEPIQKLDEMLTTLDQKLFSLVDNEIPEIEADSALPEMTRNRYSDLSDSYHDMKELYADTNRPADQYASQVQDLRTKHLSQVEALQNDLKIAVPPQLLAILKARPTDGQSMAMVDVIVPAPLQSRLLRGRLSERGAGLRLPSGSSPAQSARDRMQTLRDRMRARRGIR
jgi:S1-C subfamily serine protease